MHQTFVLQASAEATIATLSRRLEDAVAVSEALTESDAKWRRWMDMDPARLERIDRARVACDLADLRAALTAHKRANSTLGQDLFAAREEVARAHAAADEARQVAAQQAEMIDSVMAQRNALSADVARLEATLVSERAASLATAQEAIVAAELACSATASSASLSSSPSAAASSDEAGSHRRAPAAQQGQEGLALRRELEAEQERVARLLEERERLSRLREAGGRRLSSNEAQGGATVAAGSRGERRSDSIWQQTATEMAATGTTEAVEPRFPRLGEADEPTTFVIMWLLSLLLPASSKADPGGGRVYAV